MFTVYKHTTPSGKIYIGITQMNVNGRWLSGYGYQKNEHFFRAIKKYGWNNIKHEIIASNLTKEDACKLEIELIAKFDTTNPTKGYNKSTGGESGSKGTKLSDEAKQKLREINRGKKLSEETRAKISRTMQGRPPNNKGKTLKQETRQKMSQSRKGRKLSEEAKRKIGDAHIGMHWNLTEQTRKRMSEAQKGLRHRTLFKKVLCVELDIVYPSIVDAANDMKIDRANISSVCNGKRKKAGGYSWKHIQEEVAL